MAFAIQSMQNFTKPQPAGGQATPSFVAASPAEKKRIELYSGVRKRGERRTELEFELSNKSS